MLWRTVSGAARVGVHESAKESGIERLDQGKVQHLVSISILGLGGMAEGSEIQPCSGLAFRVVVETCLKKEQPTQLLGDKGGVVS